MTHCKPLANIVSECIELAKLVPSSHNCQPWRVHLHHADIPFDGTVTISIDSKHTINALSSLKNEMLMSLAGFSCALINLLEASGVVCEVQSNAANLSVIDNEDTQILSMYLTLKPNSADDARFVRLSQLLQSRYTHRGKLHADKPLQWQQDVLLTKVWSSEQLHWLHITAQKKTQIAKLVARFAALDFSHRKAWQETYRFIDFAKTKHTKKERGFNIQQLMGPLSPFKRRLNQLLLHPNVMLVLNKFGMAQKMADMLATLSEQSSQLICLCHSDKTDATAWLGAGEYMLEAWLQATEQNLAIHPLSVLLQHSDAKTALHHTLGVQHSPMFIARVGKSDTEQSFITRFRYRTALSRILTQH
ncbi:nitroreductase [Pseudoalteromonas sp. JBTF-M23]|uniref:Nitroreductase n=1 Tax=Pseudoalteromonas caenipelagi TaxID=2726988 RepID=A0A849V8L6_9GAMM|nr:nitroreductase [Pseudoalteromonas caenipelagi]NOU49899.1 nitroreductase [Pseudoalteromonas caenipelagi]